MVQCNRCHLQYIGETKRRLKDRFNEHRRTVDKTNTKSTPTTVAEHFRSHNHRYTDMQLIPLELIHSSRDSIRKARESFLIDLAGTLEPHGLNKRDELKYVIMLSCYLLSFLFVLSYVCHFRHSYKLRNMYCETIHDIILLFHFYNLVTSKPEEGWYGQPKYCLLKYNVVNQPCSSL